MAKTSDGTSTCENPAARAALFPPNRGKTEQTNVLQERRFCRLNTELDAAQLIL